MELGDKNSQKGVKVKDGKRNHVHPAVFIYARRKRVGLLRCSPSHTHTYTHTPNLAPTVFALPANSLKS